MVYSTTPATTATFTTEEGVNDYMQRMNFPQFTQEQFARIRKNPLTDKNTYVAAVGDKYIVHCQNGQKLTVGMWLRFDSRTNLFNLRYNKIIKTA